MSQKPSPSTKPNSRGRRTRAPIFLLVVILALLVAFLLR